MVSQNFLENASDLPVESLAHKLAGTSVIESNCSIFTIVSLLGSHQAEF